LRKLSIHPNSFVILDYQLAIIDECEKAENAGHEMNVEKMWDPLLSERRGEIDRWGNFED